MKKKKSLVVYLFMGLFFATAGSFLCVMLYNLFNPTGMSDFSLEIVLSLLFVAELLIIFRQSNKIEWEAINRLNKSLSDLEASMEKETSERDVFEEKLLILFKKLKEKPDSSECDSDNAE